MNRIVGTLFGVCLGLLTPVTWMVGSAYIARRAWWIKWIKTELSRNTEFYVVLTLIAVGVLGFIGFLIGTRIDQMEEDTDTAEDSNLELSHLAATDGLTGLYNGRAMQERMSIEMENAVRSPLSCLIIDIDHFKKINDKHGHPFGDEVLVGVANILKNAVRRIDAVGRLGGEEFLILLPDTSEERARAIADRIREMIQSEKFSHSGKKVRVTVSVGIANNKAPGLSPEMGILQAADDALYEAKNTGRNRTVVWQYREED